MPLIDYDGHAIAFRGDGDLWWCWLTMWWLIGYEAARLPTGDQSANPDRSNRDRIPDLYRGVGRANDDTK